jgi:hypothetical protein
LGARSGKCEPVSDKIMLKKQRSESLPAADYRPKPAMGLGLDGE